MSTNMFNGLCNVLMVCLYLTKYSSGKMENFAKENETRRHHAVATYFRRLNLDGLLIDRKGQEYGKDIALPIISKHFRNNAKLSVHPETVENGAGIYVYWQGIQTPKKDDWIGFYCPEDDNAYHYLDYIKVTTSPTWTEGYGSAFVYVYNIRTACNFRYYRSNKYSELVAKSNPLTFVGGTDKPHHGHLSLTGNPTEMTIMWTSGNVANAPFVQYGVQISSLDYTSEATSHTYKASDLCGPPASTQGFWDPGYIHRATMADLEPDTTYYYTFGSQKMMSPIYNFTTAPSPGDHSPFKFIAYGDMGLTSYQGGQETAKLMQDEVVKNGARFILHDGDISYAEGMSYIWEQWFTLIEKYATLVPYMVSIGNHEQDHTSGGAKDPSKAPGEGFHPRWGNYGDDSGGECGVPMFYRFTMPDNGNGLWWYSYNYGMVHFVIMSTEHNFTTDSRQFTWLVKDLQSVDRKATPWVVVLGHRPMYCSGRYEDDYRVTVFMRHYLEEIFYKYKVDIAIWGHYHSYERTCKVYKERCDKEGTLHLMIGSAGALLDYGIYYKKAWSVYREDTHGYGRFTVANRTAMHFEFIRNKDQVVSDHVWLYK